MPVTLELVAPQAGFKVCDMIVHAGNIYGVGTGGKLYVFDGSAWVVVVNTALAGSTVFFRIISAGGSLYAFDLEDFVVGAASVWVWDGATAWTSLDIGGTYGTGTNHFVRCGIAHDNKLTLAILTGGTNGRIVQWSGSAWTNLSSVYTPSTNQPSLIASYSGGLFGLSLNSQLFTIIAGVITAVSAEVTTGGGAHWRSPIILVNHPFLDFESSLYMGLIPLSDTLELGDLFQWNGTSAWVSKVPYDADLAGCECLFLFGSSLAMVANDPDVYVFDGVSAFTSVVATPTGAGLRVGFVFGGSTYVLEGGATPGNLYKMVEPVTVDNSIFNYGGLG